jgi:FkbM family methyltransferase
MRPPRVLAAAVLGRLLSPFVPNRMGLPFSYWLYRLGGGCVPELVHLDRFIASTRTAIDVGANKGWFTYRLCKRFEHVYAFEINDDEAGLIVGFNANNVTLFRCGLSSASKVSKFYVPVLGSLVLSSWGSLDCENAPGANRLIEKTVQVKPLDDFGISSVDFMKIDVEGHELEVLKGASATIGESRPIVLIEVRDWNLPAVDAWFQALDFQHFTIGDFLNIKEAGGDHIYVPIELISRLGLRTESRQPASFR